MKTNKKRYALNIANEHIKKQCKYVRDEMELAMTGLDVAAINGNYTEFMAEKGRLLKSMNINQFLHTELCPYCLFYEDNCAKCAYGNTKGPCKNHYSKFKKLVDTDNLVSDLIDDYAKYCPDVEEEREKRDISIRDVHIVEDSKV